MYMYVICFVNTIALHFTTNLIMDESKTLLEHLNVSIVDN